MRFNGAAESLDVRSCYPWLMAAIHRRFLVSNGYDTTSVDSLMDLIEAGKLYSTLAEMTDVPYETNVEQRRMKQSFQMFCLFGKKIVRHPLWLALESICPGVCKDIRWWRRQPGGASRLAHMLMRAEGALMTDGLVRHLVDEGVPVIQIHDGALVPVGKAQIAEEWILAESFRQYGRSCALKVEVL